MTGQLSASRPRHGAAHRGQGKRAGIDLEQIVKSARRLGVTDLTMQAVADDLGVDRKTINHYVQTRERLYRLVALSALADSVRDVQVPPQAVWQDAVRIFANAFVDALLAEGQIIEHIRLDGELAACFVDLTEQVAARLSAAGFDDEAIVRILAQVTSFGMAYARDASPNQRDPDPHRPDVLREALGARPGTFPHLSRIAAARVDTYDRSQLNLTIETFVRGTEAIAPRPSR